MSPLVQDVRFGLRMLAKNPGFTVVAVLTLALGIGGNVAVFSLLDTVMLRPLPYSHPERLYLLFPIDSHDHYSSVATTYASFQDWREQNHKFDAMAGYQEEAFNLTGTVAPERLDGLISTPGLLALLGVSPILGREFSPNDDSHVVLLSYELWRRRFDGDATMVGKSIHLDGRAYAVLGILPPHFHFPPNRWEGDPGVFVPFTPNPEGDPNWVRVIGRLAPRATAQQARTEMNVIAARAAKASADSVEGVVVDQLTKYLASGARRTVWVLFGAVAFVLLIACTNVANLLLSQGATREREIAIRTAVGATRWRIVRQLLTECLLLAGMGGALGIGLAYWAFPLLGSSLPQHSFFSTRAHDAGFELDSTVLMFTVLLCGSACILFGLLPAWRYTQPARSSAASLRPGRMSGALIGLEVALSMVLLVGAGLMMKSLVHLLGNNLGFRTEHLLSVTVNLKGEKYVSGQSQTAFYEQVLRGLGSLPSVASAAATEDLPLTRSWQGTAFEMPGPRPRKGRANYETVSPNYFRTMGITLLNGREILTTDSARSPLVGVINRSMAQKYWPGENPIGKTIIASHTVVVSSSQGSRIESKPQELKIVGIVGDIRQLGLDAPPYPELFIPYTQWPSNEMTFVLHTATDPSSLVPSIKREIWRVDPDQPVTHIRTMDDLISAEASGRWFVLELIGIFAAIALVLAAVGIYGVVSYTTRQRTHEIGIRLALGAKGRQILWLVAGQNAKWLLVGITTGIASAFALTRILAAYLYDVRPTDPLTFVAAPLFLLAVALLAIYIPARRATKVDPMEALRYE